MDEKVIPHLVARFLSWKLPHDFRSDAGISFVPEYNNGTDNARETLRILDYFTACADDQ